MRWCLLLPAVLLAACPTAGGRDDEPDAAESRDDPPPEGEEALLTLGDEVVCADPAGPGPLPMDDVTEEAGVAYAAATPEWSVESFPLLHPSVEIESSGGFAVADLNGDDHLDLLFSDAVAPVRLFFGDGALGFTPADPEEHGLPPAGTWVHGASAADYDGDGDFDLLLLRNGENVLLRNDGAARFTEVTADAGLLAGELRSLSGTWADPDGDGDLDLYIANHGTGSYGPDLPAEVHADQFLVQTEPGRFEDHIERLQVNGGLGYAFVGGFFDADMDGLTDFYLVNDLGTEGPHTEPNRFFRGEGADEDGLPVFRSAPEANLDVAVLGMGLALGDWDNDGDWDLHVTDAGPTRLLRNDGDQGFTDVSLAVAGFSSRERGDISWGTVFFDHDNDGAVELFTAFGHMPTKADGRAPGEAGNRVEMPDTLWTPAQGSWEDLAPAVGIDDAGMTRAVVAADLDRDGFTDLVTWRLYDGPRIHRSRCNGNAWLRVRLEQPGTRNVHAVGARVEAWVGGAPWVMRAITAGTDQVMSSGPPEAMLGLGERETVHLVVHWPDGHVTVNPNVPTRREVVLRREP